MTLGLTPSPWFLIRWRLNFMASQPFPVSVSGQIPLPSTTPVPCWCRKGQRQVIETQTVPEYPLQLGCRTLALQDPPHISHLFIIILKWKLQRSCLEAQNFTFVAFTSISGYRNYNEGIQRNTLYYVPLVVYSVFLWIPPVLFRYPETKATDLRLSALKFGTSVAFVTG